ncbi:Sua5/YciO/YrdC/YwlC family protein [Streptomyces noursei]|uniref:Sua5/YciO/YrdC/YwlC family protein n=1 Tax=Streptomyces noursei TaxID=1971 RepID=UPI0023B7C2A2|nr:Sua5/YciO/YrdC/YwlC family protein [Streptomyces noursei]
MSHRPAVDATPATSDTATVHHALAQGRAVVLPNPAPLTCVVTATRPAAVNVAKGRPADQAVALWAHHPHTREELTEHLDLGPDAHRLARRLLTEELVTLLAPLRRPHGVPSWLAPAARDGWTLLFAARWQPLAPLLDDFPLLYVSSANRTGHPPAATPAEAAPHFAPRTPVLTAPTPLAASPRRATTTIRVHPDARTELHRHGAQDHPHPSAEHYLNHLHHTYRTPPTA